MDDLIKNSIESRIDCIYNSYEIEDEDIKDEIIDIKNRLYELGRSCLDVGEFETKLAGSSLNQEYIDLFTKLAMNCKVKGAEEEKEESVLEEIGDDAARYVRRKARQEAYDKVRDVPVVGEVLTAKQHFDFINRFRKKDE